MIRKIIFPLIFLLPFLSYSVLAAPLQKALFAGGCFWCMEPPFESLKGVTEVISGYAGGNTKNPTYEEVSSGKTGHYEVVQISFDPTLVSYKELLEVFWRNVDPTDSAGQFCDKGQQYKSAIFTLNEEQKKEAENSKNYWIKSGRLGGKKIETLILASSSFYPAEDYHQDYYKKNPIRYKYYRYRCGRDQVLQKIWGP